jgi:hypothetical protein
VIARHILGVCCVVGLLLASAAQAFEAGAARDGSAVAMPWAYAITERHSGPVIFTGRCSGGSHAFFCAYQELQYFR